MGQKKQCQMQQLWETASHTELLSSHTGEIWPTWLTSVVDMLICSHTWTRTESIGPSPSVPWPGWFLGGIHTSTLDDNDLNAHVSMPILTDISSIFIIPVNRSPYHQKINFQIYMIILNIIRGNIWNCIILCYKRIVVAMW